MMMGSVRNYWEGLVGLAGLEPAARGLGNLCSVHLSYRPLPVILHVYFLRVNRDWG